MQNIEYKKLWYQKNKNRLKKKFQNYYIKNKDWLTILSKNYRNLNKTKIKERNKEYLEKNKKIIYLKRQIYRRKIKLQLINGYKGYCQCCKETNPEFLSLDHKFGGGRKEQKKFGTNTQLYLYLIKNGFPKNRYQLLCMNCNCAKRQNKKCPHQINNMIINNYKKDVIEKYGGKCVCCGESNIFFLTIDHINGNGGQHRKQEKLSRSIYKWLRTNNYPKDNFRLLCYNCNCSLGFYGYCPHKEKRDFISV